MSALPESILLATDGSREAVMARRAAAGIVSVTGAALHVAHVWQAPPAAFPTVVNEELYERRARELLKNEMRQLEKEGVRATEHLERGLAVDGILKLCRSQGNDMVVMGGKGEGILKRVHIGSVTEGVAYYSSSPVLVVRGAWPPSRIVIADDGSEAAAEAGDLAARLGMLLEDRAIMVQAYSRLPQTTEEERGLYAWRVEDELRAAEGILEDRAGELGKLLGERVRTRVVVGDPAEVVLRAAAEWGEPQKTLIAVGSRGLGKGRMRLGGVAKKVLKAARGPVLLHPEPRT